MLIILNHVTCVFVVLSGQVFSGSRPEGTLDGFLGSVMKEFVGEPPTARVFSEV